MLGLSLARAGRQTTIFDPATIGANASGIAAGMLAPASEALEFGGASFERLRRARDLWPDLAASTGVAIDRSGAVHLSGAEASPRVLEAFSSIGARAERAAPPDWISGSTVDEAVRTCEDWRLEPIDALHALHRAFLAAGGEWIASAVSSTADVDALRACAHVVIAMGWEAGRHSTLAPELAHLSPIKGQILRVEAGPRSGPVVRHAEGYLAPSVEGLLVGATMEPGASDLELDPGKLDGLQLVAARIAPGIEGMNRTAAAGVRAATPDGWPLVGRSSAGLWLSVGARRNGWLLAPLMAEVLHAHLEGRAHEDADAFAPDRFEDH